MGKYTIAPAEVEPLWKPTKWDRAWYTSKKLLKIMAVCCLCMMPAFILGRIIFPSLSIYHGAIILLAFWGGVIYISWVAKNGPRHISDVEYYEYDCGSPCTQDGCFGHSTDIPVSIEINGVWFDVQGYYGGDYPGSGNDEEDRERIKRVKEVVTALS